MGICGNLGEGRGGMLGVREVQGEDEPFAVRYWREWVCGIAEVGGEGVWGNVR